MCLCLLIQDGDTPLQVAIRRNAYKVVYLLVIQCGQEITHLSQVSNHVLVIVTS